MFDDWNGKDTLQVLIEIVLGFFISWFVAFYYEYKTTKRKARILFEQYGFLQSNENNFDWQHWGIVNGKIETKPLEIYMTLKYDGEKTFSFRWKNSSDEVLGDGYIYWDNLTQGKLSFHEFITQWFDYRNLFYRRIAHQGTLYDAIFINADDQRNKYVMLRPVLNCSFK